MRTKSQPDTNRPYRTVREVSQHLGVSRRLVWQWIAEGRLRAARLGPRVLRVATEDLEAFLTSAREASR